MEQLIADNFIIIISMVSVITLSGASFIGGISGM